MLQGCWLTKKSFPSQSLRDKDVAMRFVLDESVGQAITQYLRDSGHDVLAIVEVAPRANDIDILQRATEEKRIVITNDKDFGELVYRSGLAHEGVLLFRLRNEHPANQVLVLTEVLNNYADELPGNFVTVTDGSVRIRGAVDLPTVPAIEGEEP